MTLFWGVLSCTRTSATVSWRQFSWDGRIHPGQSRNQKVFTPVQTSVIALRRCRRLFQTMKLLFTHLSVTLRTHSKRTPVTPAQQNSCQVCPCGCGLRTENQASAVYFNSFIHFFICTELSLCASVWMLCAECRQRPIPVHYWQQ